MREFEQRIGPGSRTGFQRSCLFVELDRQDAHPATGADLAPGLAETGAPLEFLERLGGDVFQRLRDGFGLVASPRRRCAWFRDPGRGLALHPQFCNKCWKIQRKRVIQRTLDRHMGEEIYSQA